MADTATAERVQLLTSDMVACPPWRPADMR